MKIVRAIGRFAFAYLAVETSLALLVALLVFVQGGWMLVGVVLSAAAAITLLRESRR